MKRYLSYILIGIVAAGCTTMYGPEQQPTPVVPSDGLELTLGEVKDSSVMVTIAPKGEASYYSYCVLQAEDKDAKPEVLDSVGVYTLAYEDAAVQCGTIKWTAEKPSATVMVKPLDPDAYYYFYAVAGSVEGVPSTVTAMAFHTTDAVAPGLEGKDAVDATGNVVTLTYPEEVTYDKEVKLKAMVYAVNSAEYEQYAPFTSVDIPADSVSVSGNVVTISIPDLSAGAEYTLSLPEGAFFDSVNNKSPEVYSGYDVVKEEIVRVGIWGAVDNEPFELKKLDLEYIHDFNAPITVAAADGRELLYTGENNVKATYKFQDKTTTFELSYRRTFVVNAEGNLLFVLKNGSEIPGRGSDVNLSVDAKVFQDVYGNENKAWKLESFYAYEYTMENIYGTFGGYIASQETQGQFANVGPFLTVSPLGEGDDKDSGNCKITSIYGFATETMYATFVPERGTLSIEDSQLVTDSYKDENVDKANLIFLSLDEDAAPVVLNMYEQGTLEGPSVPFALLINAENPAASGPFDIVLALMLSKNK